MHCTNCGKEVADNVKFCDGCGSPMPSGQGNAQQNYQRGPATGEAQDNKVIFILAYLGILFFLPLVSTPNSKVGRFHANQGLVLLLASIAGGIVVSILSAIFLAISWRLWVIPSLLSWVWWLAIAALAIIGMMNANKGLQKPLPIIGKFTIIK